jgi:hypothetical protein
LRLPETAGVYLLEGALLDSRTGVTLARHAVATIRQ